MKLRRAGRSCAGRSCAWSVAHSFRRRTSRSIIYRRLRHGERAQTPAPRTRTPSLKPCCCARGCKSEAGSGRISRKQQDQATPLLSRSDRGRRPTEACENPAFSIRSVQSCPPFAERAATTTVLVGHPALGTTTLLRRSAATARQDRTDFTETAGSSNFLEVAVGSSMRPTEGCENPAFSIRSVQSCPPFAERAEEEVSRCARDDSFTSTSAADAATSGP